MNFLANNRAAPHRVAALVVTGVVGFARAASAADPQTNAAPSHWLLIDRLGNAVRVPTNEIHSSLHPPEAVGMGHQIPVPQKGAPMPDEVRQRIKDSKTDRQWFSTTPPNVMPYLANLDEYGNTAIQPGPLINIEPFSAGAQSLKYWASEVGLRYSLYQSLTMVSMTDVASGSSALQYYTATFNGKWAVTEVTSEDRAGWLSMEANAQHGLSASDLEPGQQSQCGSQLHFSIPTQPGLVNSIAI